MIGKEQTMSDSRWTWEGFKSWIGAASETRPARIAYSAGAGCSVAGSIVYVGTVLSSCLPPALICCVASTACLSTTGIRYQQLTTNGTRVGELQRESTENQKLIQELKAQVNILETQMMEVHFASQQHTEVVSHLIETMPDDEKREHCEHIMEIPREEMGVLIAQHQKKMPTADSILVADDPTKKSRVNQSTLFGRVAAQLAASKRYQAAPPMDQSFDENERDADDILGRDFNEIELSAVPEELEEQQSQPTATESSGLLSMSRRIFYT